MTYYTYVTPDGLPDVSTYPLNLEIFPGYVLLGESEEEPNLRGKKYVNGQWVKIDQTPDYVYARKNAYPDMGAQLDAIWHAMDQGILPKIEPMYSDILAVKQAIPKRSN